MIVAQLISTGRMSKQANILIHLPFIIRYLLFFFGVNKKITTVPTLKYEDIITQ